MKISPKVTILLSTFNGDAYLEQLLDSLLSQDYENWRMIIRDDGSSDETLSIVSKYSKDYPDKFELNMIESRNVGAAQSFGLLLSYAIHAEYVMFCDQDDIWLPSKISSTLNAMQHAEHVYDGPILIHTDLTVTNAELEKIDSSYWAYQNINPSRDKLNYLLVQNVVTGCTVMINRKLVHLVNPLQQGVIMHDWWIALVASAFGKIEYIKEPTILYRQHLKNEVGASRYSVLKQLQKYKIASKRILMLVKQAIIFEDTYSSVLTKQQLQLLSTFSNIIKTNRLQRVMAIIRYSLLKTGFIRNFGFLLILIIINKEAQKVYNEIH
ncbi:glycosyltransferase family 2 protein [Paenibacillus gansuensis]|uniref:Glycosyltransferase family 2 protein n=1 Tax=Paenibacillus gansuensis TaxID=306542 RepID=A0ABW5PH27_9BACL